MTNDSVIDQVARDPLVRRAHTTYPPGQPPRVPPESVLRAIAESELQNELNSILNKPQFRRQLRERDYSLTLSTGTAVTQGVRFTLPDNVGSVINITAGDSQRPLMRWRSRTDFDRWYYENIGATSTTNQAHGWLEWGFSNTGALDILISPGSGTDTDANVHYVRTVKQPVGINELPDDVQYLAVTGTKNRASGGRHEFSYERDLRDIEKRIEGMIGGSSPMPLGQSQRRINWAISNSMYGSSSDSSAPGFISRTQ